MNTLRLNANLNAIAHHEAGHFIATHRLQPTCIQEYVTVIPSDGNLGAVTAEELYPRLNEDHSCSYRAEDVRAEVVSLLAGRAAEVRLNPSRSEEGLGGASNDYEKAVALLDYIVPTQEENTALLKILETEATELVNQHWKEVQTLANALVERGTIDGDECQVIADFAAGIISLAELEQYREFRKACSG